MDESLKKYFGYNEFRPHQREIVSNCLAGKDVLAVLPTGAGKSICYQLPAMMLPGTTIVVSPLISLMQDQVVSLTKNGLAAAFINSSLPHQEMLQIMQNLSHYKMIYVAPERLFKEEFIKALQKIPISLFAIDEAHCISQWGHAFRPEYRQMGVLKTLFPTTPVMALTATATQDVKNDIIAQLAMKDPYVVRASFDRPNLTFRIYPRMKGHEQILEFVKKHPNKSGILYGATRKVVEETHLMLQEQGFKPGKYHAGLTDAERTQAQHDFVHGDCQLMVATVAFGMGIHKPDIRYILHLDMPRTIEQYYQEIGRAGRDGIASECLMLYSAKELKVYELFLQDLPDPTTRSMMEKKTDQMVDLCHRSSCRRKAMLGYFGESYPHTNCDGCDQCLDDTELTDCTLIAQKILSCVYRLQERFGARQVIDVLRGAKTKAVVEKGHEQLSTFNLMPECSEEELRHYIQALTEKGYLERTSGDYPVLKWTETSRDVTRGQKTVMLRKKTTTHIEKKKKNTDLECDQKLFEELVAVRKKLSKDAGIAAFIIFPDRTLIEMSQFYPSTREAFLNLNGVSQAKWEKYGTTFLATILHYCAVNKISAQKTVPVKRIAPPPRPTTSNHSAETTLSLFQSGLAPEDIALQRKLSYGTVIEHILDQMGRGKFVDISPIVSEDRQAEIREAIANCGAEKLAPIKLALPGDYTYDEIRLVRALWTSKV